MTEEKVRQMFSDYIAAILISSTSRTIREMNIETLQSVVLVAAHGLAEKFASIEFPYFIGTRDNAA